MLTLSYSLHTLPHLTGRVNVAQLAEVQHTYMPPHAVRFAAEPELLRVAHEVATERPELADELKYVTEQELHRRTAKMSIVC